VPADDYSGGAIEARAPEFIDLLTSENEEYQVKLGGGLMWLDGICNDRYERLYLDCSRRIRTSAKAWSSSHFSATSRSTAVTPAKSGQKT
jgi:hypothetical protein